MADRDPYPCVVFLDRYMGAYSGARWIALNERQVPEDAMGADINAQEFCRTWTKPVGRGDTAMLAVNDLKARMYG